MAILVNLEKTPVWVSVSVLNRTELHLLFVIGLRKQMPETTENYHHIPVSKKKKSAKIVTIAIGKGGIKALYDVKNKVILTYLFPVGKFTMKEARKWIKNHGHKVVASLLDLVDRLDYLKEAIVALQEK
jgi:hypothetical protein